MIEPLLNAAQMVGLALLVGEPVYRWVVAGSAADRPLAPGPGPKVRLAAIGFVLLTVGALGDGVRAAAAVWGRVDLAHLAAFFVESRYGRIIVIQLALAAAFGFLSAFVSTRRRSTAARFLLPALGTGMVLGVSGASHAGSAGAAMTVIHLVHVGSVAVWGGALLHFALDPAGADSRTSSPARMEKSARRLSTLGQAAVGAILVTGGLMAARFIYGAPALTGTPYGQSLIVKLILVAGVLAAAAVNRFSIVPLLSRPEATEAAHRLRRTVRVEAALVLAVLTATGVLTGQVPPEEPLTIPQPIRRAGDAGGIRYELELEPGDTGTIVFWLRLADPAGVPLESAAFVTLWMPEHVMPEHRIAMTPVESGVLRGEAVLPMSGRWQAVFQLAGSQSGPEPKTDSVSGIATETALAVIDFVAGISPREAQFVWYFTWQRAFGRVQGVLWLLVYVGLVVFGVRALRVASGPRPFYPLAVSASLLLFASVWQVGSLFVGRGYPTAGLANPVPDTAETAELGRQLFQVHCAVCHGPEGRGDGPQGAMLWPPAADLTEPYIQMHSDGELFWSISKGVPATAMPGFEQLLTEEERWAVIRYLRLLAEP
ncbi:MAG: CopD family protein [Firmicutes bacterium]|nr:CopD family protein [Bacillota bacterium]